MGATGYRAGMPSARDASPDGSRRLAGHVALVAVQFCFGLFPIFGKWAFGEGGFEPQAVACWRIVVASVVLCLFALRRYGRASLPPREEIGPIALCSLLGVVMNQGLYLEGLKRSDAMHAGLLMCLIPVFTFVIAAAAGQERFDWTRALGVSVAFLGAAPFFVGRGLNLFEHSLGSLLLAGNSLCYALYLVLSKTLTRRHSPWLVIAWVYAFSLPGALWFGLNTRLLPEDPTSTRAWGALASILVFATVLGYALNLFALSRVRASTTAVYIYVQPLLTACGAMLLLGESLTPRILLSGALLFSGIALVARRRGSAG